MTSLRFTPVALALGFFLAITFALCVIWGLIFPHTVFQQQFLEAAFPWFTWLSWGSFLLGLAESFLYGVYGAAAFVPLYNGLNRWSCQSAAKV
ncbi:MAG TPA: DUF5676 family membrane protein [Candidatus Methylomirabilis sp.]|nr:DUF5676 family membrane protein [Candidatus Methylomirabilis sp.]HSC71748.1 DUF5676 family membrane protein [Candidatus Methylomirabilis sp.]